MEKKMKIIEQSHEILSLPENILLMMERAGRTCYKSEDKITPDSAEKFVEMLIKRGHHAMIEFGNIIVKFVTNRGVTHEIVRHRLSSFAQESTRYVKYDGEMEFIRPVWCDKDVVGASFKKLKSIKYTDTEYTWMDACLNSEIMYKRLLDSGWRPEQAREVLPNSLKTEIVWKANIREWRHIFSLRCSKAAHPQMSALMKPLLAELQARVPIVFDDII
jgi:thymidylate synthase (FAD)